MCCGRWRRCWERRGGWSGGGELCDSRRTPVAGESHQGHDSPCFRVLSRLHPSSRILCGWQQGYLGQRKYRCTCLCLCVSFRLRHPLLTLSPPPPVQSRSLPVALARLYPFLVTCTSRQAASSVTAHFGPTTDNLPSQFRQLAPCPSWLQPVALSGQRGPRDRRPSARGLSSDERR